ncbi:MAG: NAD-dependent epimerase/dehydratase family protein [Sandaracinaceae bacterium]
MTSSRAEPDLRLVEGRGRTEAGDAGEAERVSPLAGAEAQRRPGPSTSTPPCYAPRPMDLEGATVAITGIGGFIGRRAAVRFRERGLTVRGLEVDERARAPLLDQGWDVRAGDVTDRSAVRPFVEGADVVLHAAALVREDGPRRLFEHVNVGGTRVVAQACAAAGVARLVHLSSVMVYGFDYPPAVDEEGPFPALLTNPYCATKLKSEGVALAVDGDGTGVVVLRPGDVYGPGSEPWVERPIRLMRQGLFVLPDEGQGVINHLHVDNLIDAVFLALEGDVLSVPINVTDGVATSCREYFTRLAAWAGLPPPPHAPSALLRPAFGALSLGARLLRREPAARPAALRYLQRPHAYSIERARRMLGYQPRIDLAQGLAAL